MTVTASQPSNLARKKATDRVGPIQIPEHPAMPVTADNHGADVTHGENSNA